MLRTRATIADALSGAFTGGVPLQRIGIDTAPVIYFAERNLEFFSHCLPFFNAIQTGGIDGVVSMVTLAEVLVVPHQKGDQQALHTYQQMLRPAQGIECRPITRAVATQAAGLRARYSALRMPDALCLATALLSRCDAFLTNDSRLNRVQEIPVLVLQELTP